LIIFFGQETSFFFKVLMFLLCPPEKDQRSCTIFFYDLPPEGDMAWLSAILREE
jgi:hypothetical protein